MYAVYILHIHSKLYILRHTYIIRGQQMVESQIQKKELLEEEVNVSFFIQFVTVEGQYSTYHKLYAKISSNENEVSLQYLSPE